MSSVTQTKTQERSKQGGSQTRIRNGHVRVRNLNVKLTETEYNSLLGAVSDRGERSVSDFIRGLISQAIRAITEEKVKKEN